MGRFSLSFNGLDELKVKVLEVSKMAAVHEIVKDNGAGLHKKMVEKAKFKGHYRGKKFVKPTGATRRSITTEISSNGMKVTVGPHTAYSPYLEKGTRKMAAQPFVKPAYDMQKVKFKSDLERLFR